MLGKFSFILKCLVVGLMLSSGVGCNDAGQRGGGFSLFDGLRRSNLQTWTILCREFQGPRHQEYCEQFADSLKRTQGIRPDEVRCEHDNAGQISRLYYGSYERTIDPQTEEPSPNAQLDQDMYLITDLGDPQKGRYFVMARKVPMVDTYRGPAEWDLRQARGVYTLQVAVFRPEKDFQEVRKAAVDYCRSLRRDGYEAYYYHGPAQSVVTVGTFDESDVFEVNGVQKYSARVRRLQHKEAFKYNYENGQKRVRIVHEQVIENGKVKDVESRKEPYSFLVKIPGSDQNM